MHDIFQRKLYFSIGLLSVDQFNLRYFVRNSIYLYYRFTNTLLNMHSMRPTMAIRFLTSIVLLSFVLVNGAHGIQTDAEAVAYLTQFGYLSSSLINQNSKQKISREMMSEALMELQSFAGIKQTGQLNAETIHLMNLPRCGVQDKTVSKDLRGKRSVSYGNKWEKNDLTYSITRYSDHMSESETDEEIKSAFKLWSDVTPLTFTRLESGPVDIEIKFEIDNHGNVLSFDKPGIFAHTSLDFSDSLKRWVHFNDFQNWTINNPYENGIEFFQVAVHELGHILGLTHSNVNAAVMAPFNKVYDPNLSLHEDDIKAIQKIYGPKKALAEPEESITIEQNLVSEDSTATFCADVKIDTIFNMLDENTFVFKGNKYWKVLKNGLAPGYPRNIADTWSKLPGNIDAAFTLKTGKTYFFKGDQFWRYTRTTMDKSFPRYISDGFPGVPDNVDSAVVWNIPDRTVIYFFKGSKFWKYDLKERTVNSSYPKTIKYHWYGIPNNIDGVLQDTNGLVYFFKGDQYYRLENGTFEVDTSTSRPFPRNSGEYWFGC